MLINSSGVGALLVLGQQHMVHPLDVLVDVDGMIDAIYIIIPRIQEGPAHNSPTDHTDDEEQIGTRPRVTDHPSLTSLNTTLLLIRVGGGQIRNYY